MAEIDLPIWLHPWRGPDVPDYPTETRSKHDMWWVFGWPYETSIAMSRIVFAGYFDRFPTLKIIVHHMGSMVPHFAGRVGPGLDQLGARSENEDLSDVRRLKKRPYEYFQMFYGDTALFGARHAMQCGLEFETIRCLEEMPLSDEDRRRIYEGNARSLLRLRGI